MNFLGAKHFGFLLLLGFLLAPLSLSAQEENKSGVYIVKKGDTLYSIGRRLGVSSSEIARQNEIADPNKIHVGQVLVIPRESTISAPVSRSKATKALSQKQNEFEEEYSSAPRAQPTSSEPEPLALSSEEVIELEDKPGEEKDPHRHFIGGSMTAWFAFIEEASVRASRGPIRGTGIDLQDALDVDDYSTVPVVNAWVEPFPWLKVQGEYMEFGLDGKRTIDETIVYRGFTFGIRDEVKAELDVQRASGWLELNPFRGKWGYLGGMVGGEFAHVEAELSDRLIGSVSDDANAGTVSLGGQARFFITDEIEMGGRIRAFSYEISDIEFSFVDFQVDASYTLFNCLELAGGYRALFLEVSHEDAEGDLTLHGPFISGGIKF